jgi:hypothetical protein
VGAILYLRRVDSALHVAYGGKLSDDEYRMAHLCTPVFTRRVFPDLTQNFQQVIVAQAQLQFVARVCPLYPKTNFLISFAKGRIVTRIFLRLHFAH